jgi:hypothetical protein
MTFRNMPQLKKAAQDQSNTSILDIESAYDTVDRDIVWNGLKNTMSPALLALL